MGPQGYFLCPKLVCVCLAAMYLCYSGDVIGWQDVTLSPFPAFVFCALFFCVLWKVGGDRTIVLFRAEHSPIA